MEKNYRVVFVYPDSHIEEIEEVFNDGKEALEYGNSMLVQVANTEQFHAFADEKIQPYFMIVEVNGKKHRMVYNSK